LTIRTIITLPCIIASLAAVSYLPSSAYAQAEESMLSASDSRVINNVIVRGNQRVEEQTVKSYLDLRGGQAYSAQDINRAVKKLFETGFFSDVTVNRVNSDLVVTVVENPVVNKVVFEGNDQIDDKDLETEVVMRARSIYTRTQVQNDVKRILDLYRSNGRYSATVNPQVITLEQNRVNLVYEIAEGPVTRIEKVSFIGNKNFNNETLRDVIRSEEHKWYRFFSSDDKYDPDRLLYDQELLRRFYVSNGYADFQVKSAITELTPDKQGFYLTFTIEEGDRYNFGKVNVDNRLAGVNDVLLKEVVQTGEGTRFDASKIESTIDEMIQVLGDQGFAFVDVAPELDRDPHRDIIDLTYKISEGPRVYVERININGNVRTMDEVVRREFRLAEGDAYNTSKLRRSEQRINNLGYFEEVKIAEKRGSDDDKIVIDADVKERSTGELTFGVGFSTVDGALADVGVREKNLLGRGQDLRVRAMVAAERQQIDLGFTEPYFLGRDIAAGFDVFRIQQDLRQESSFDRETNGFTLRMNYALSERLRHTLNYTLRENTVSNVQPFASRFVQDQEGTTVTSSVGQSLIYDSRNNRFDPTEGWYLRLSQEYAGLGGDSDFLRHEARAEYFYPVAPKWTVQLLGLGGHILGLGEDVRIQDRFFIGGREIRGFNNAGVGPRDSITRDALGGNMYYAGTAELRFPLGLPDEMGFTGALFTDFGSLWSVDDNGPEVIDNSSVRVASGLGLAWTSPFGPIRIDFSKAVVKQDEDEEETIRFNFGTRF
jgi:outer membrane protein insertion porin family